MFSGSLQESFGRGVNMHILHHTPFNGKKRTVTAKKNFSALINPDQGRFKKNTGKSITVFILHPVLSTKGST